MMQVVVSKSTANTKVAARTTIKCILEKAIARLITAATMIFASTTTWLAPSSEKSAVT